MSEINGNSIHLSHVDESKETCSDDEDHLTNAHTLTCANCDELFPSVADLKLHRSSCDKNASPLVTTRDGAALPGDDRLASLDQQSNDHDDNMVDVSKEEHINEVDEAIKHSQDAVNNNFRSPPEDRLLQRHDDDEEPEEDSLVANEQEVDGDDEECDRISAKGDSLINKGGSKTQTNHRATSKSPNHNLSNSNIEPRADEDNEEETGEADLSGAFAPSHVTLEALQNTKVAVAQFAANAMAAGVGNGDNEAALKDLAILHSTLFQLQHQHVFQLQLIQQLQSQLSMNHRKEEKEDQEDEKSQSGQVDNQSEGFSEKRDEDEEDEDFGKLEPEIIISR